MYLIIKLVLEDVTIADELYTFFRFMKGFYDTWHNSKMKFDDKMDILYGNDKLERVDKSPSVLGFIMKWRDKQPS